MKLSVITDAEIISCSVCPSKAFPSWSITLELQILDMDGSG